MGSGNASKVHHDLCDTMVYCKHIDIRFDVIAVGSVAQDDCFRLKEHQLRVGNRQFAEPWSPTSVDLPATPIHNIPDRFTKT